MEQPWFVKNKYLIKKKAKLKTVLSLEPIQRKNVMAGVAYTCYTQHNSEFFIFFWAINILIIRMGNIQIIKFIAFYFRNYSNQQYIFFKSSSIKIN